MQSVAKVTKRETIEKVFVIPKSALVIPYPYNYLVSYPLSLKPLTGPQHAQRWPHRRIVSLKITWCFTLICF